MPLRPIGSPLASGEPKLWYSAAGSHGVEDPGLSPSMIVVLRSIPLTCNPALVMSTPPKPPALATSAVGG